MAEARDAVKRAAVKPPPAKASPSKPAAFTAPHPVYTGGIYYEAGRVFVTDAPRGTAWKPASGVPAAQG